MSEKELMKKIIRDTLWMARRYANGRQTYAAGMVNGAIDAALSLGIEVEPDSVFGMYANDGTFGMWNPELKRFVKP